MLQTKDFVSHRCFSRGQRSLIASRRISLLSVEFADPERADLGFYPRSGFRRTTANVSPHGDACIDAGDRKSACPLDMLNKDFAQK
jgi:hypothetical protein